jgi:phage terminase large subunit-like protein
MFWYLYPDFQTATMEFHEKWVKEFLPRDQHHPIYGWKAVFIKREIREIHFNTGITIYFRSYEQEPKSMQAGSVFAIFCDEEPPMSHYDELMFRLSATDGYFHAVFTPTLNQEFWAQAMMPQSKELEKLPQAMKQQVSLYDCLVYEDDSPSVWTLEKIRDREAKCKSDTERMRRIHGMFVTEEGREYSQFESTRHYCQPVQIPGDYLWYSGTDVGGGGTSHPAAHVFVAVRPDFKFGYVLKVWRGDDGETTSSDILKKWKELKGTRTLVSQAYDWGAKDFGITARREGIPFVKAEKSHDLGKDLINDLFQNDMLMVFDDDGGKKLGLELTQNMQGTPKRFKKDDCVDALRYCLTQIPWQIDLSLAPKENSEKKVTANEEPPLTERERSAYAHRGERQEPDEIVNEIAFWNSYHE